MRRRTLLLSSLLPVAARAQAAGYRVIDLMPDFWAFHARAQGLAPEAQAALFEQEVAARHPDAYAPNVIGLDPAKPYGEQLQRRYLRVLPILADRTDLMRRLSTSIARDLPRYEARFRETFPDLDYRGDIYFLHSLGGFDGGTRRVDGRTALLFGVDMIAWVYGEGIDPQPFFHHELFHIYQGQFAAAGEAERDDDPLVTALWREGLATYVAQTLNPQAGGVSIFGLPRTTPARVLANRPQLARDLRGLLDSRAPGDYKRWFLGGRDENAEVPGRAGYVLGYHVAERLAQRHPLRELARLPVTALRPEIDAALDALGRG
ncbi:hypothetical protein LZ009_08860 [Ramlibacter sp. XY19]|uniref:hypothetical protein n=1 Tax=Ramlibacter paludis TaxID=2908000 RepID=UPI0023DBC8B2|nr:hypothetical protein [Ramlibacter paludis]MCG2592889.1 hypothetical protein [Ramlibacter paludis]